MSNQLVIPRAPKGATHARIHVIGSERNQVAQVAVKDFDTLKGTAGLVTWLGPESSRSSKLVAIGETFEWNGLQALDDQGNAVTVVIPRKRGRPKKRS